MLRKHKWKILEQLEHLMEQGLYRGDGQLTNPHAGKGEFRGRIRGWCGV
ncbi:MAG: hypothetical protein ACKPJJ_03535 [Planctomycetaceae bacterium]